MNIATFEELLIAASVQPQPQRLLMTFAVAEAETGVAPGLRARTTLVPVMCVDKQVGELDTFGNLAEEATRMGQPWDVVLVTSLSGQGGRLPDAAQTDAALSQMVNAIQHGKMERLLAFDRGGDLLRHA
jgi:hypothetical protein